MEQKIIDFMKENGVAVFCEADRATGAVCIEKLGSLESWDLFQQLVLYSDVETLCDSTRSKFPFQVWGQGDTECLISWLDGDKTIALFFDCKLEGPELVKRIKKLDQKVRQICKPSSC